MSNQQPTLLIVDDDVGFQAAAQSFAKQLSYRVHRAETLGQARELAADRHFNLVLLDLSLPDGSGLDLLNGQLDADHIAIVTGHPSLASASRAVGSRVAEYLVKPLASADLLGLMERMATSTASQPGLSSDDYFEELVGRSPPMRKLYSEIQRVGGTNLTAFVIGESGTGKELVARAIHRISGRSGPFVALNCAAVTPELLASELFGHERGSFTGAHRQHAGCFERAHGGTLFLDEISEMPLPLQAHLLRVLETRTITRVGGQDELALDMRVVAASNRDPDSVVRAGQLREDLLFRLMDFPIRVPPLRERGNDVDLLAHTFLNRLNREYGTSAQFAPGVDSVLRSHDWPGNVRELLHSIRRGCLLAERGLVRLEPIARRRSGILHDDGHSLTFAVGTPFDQMQRAMLLKTLAHFDNDKTRTARALGVSVKTVYNHLARLPAGAVRGDS